MTPKTYKKFPGLLFYECGQGTPEWYRERSLSVGSSEASAAFSGGSGKTRSSLMDRKIIEQHTGEPIETYSDESMERGTKLEPKAASWFTKEMEKKDISRLFVLETGLIRNREYPGFHVSVDRLVIIDGILTFLEIKCPKKKAHLKYLEKWRLPPEYKKQVDMQQIICNTAYCFFLSWHPHHGEMLMEVPAPSTTERIRYESEMNRWNNSLADRLPMAKQIVAEHKAKAERLEKEEAELIELARVKTQELLEKIK